MANWHYRIEILQALKDKGFTSYRIRKDRLLGERTVQRLREGKDVSFDVLATVCDLLSCDVGDLLTVQPPEGDSEDQSNGG